VINALQNQTTIMKNRQFFRYFFVFLIFTQTACMPFVKINSDFEKPFAQQKPVEQTHKLRFTEVFDLSSKNGVIENDIYQLLLNKDFDTIEKVTTKAREKKERLLGGYWKIDSIYKALTNICSSASKIEITHEMWKNHINLIKEWKELSPKSITARVALAESYVNYGWFVRGTGYASTVSDDASEFLHQQLDLAERELLDSEELGVKCPRGYRTMLWIGMSNGWSNHKYNELFDEVKNSEPNYIQSYLVMSERLTPKWHGEQGEWKLFVDSIPHKLADLDTDEVDIIYFAVVAFRSGDNSVANDWSTLSMDRVKKGFADIEKKYGVDKFRLNQYARFSFRRSDLVTCREILDRIGDDWDKEVWSKKEFDAAKIFANHPMNAETN
jgi:hypothetical protein